MNKSIHGDRMKYYESLTDIRLMPRLPIVARLDGKAFSKFCKGMKKPFDLEFREAMTETTKYLVEQTNAKIGYTQSDEITLILYNDNYESESIFAGRVQKIVSTFAAWASTKFLIEMQDKFPEKVKNKYPTFDCRVFNVPSKIEAHNELLWRVKDSSTNAISMVADSHFSHKSLSNLNSSKKIEKMKLEKNVNYNEDFSIDLREGIFVKRQVFDKVLTAKQLERIPIDKRPVNNIVKRHKIEKLDMIVSYFKIANPCEFIFDDAIPLER